jgi:thiol-disulfide isomerase/thioredoxin
MSEKTAILLLLLTSVLLQSCGGEANQGATSAEPVNATSADTVSAPLHPLLATLPEDDDPAGSTFQTLDGRGFDVELFAGQKVFVNFWATWCAPCIQEIPSINNAAAALEEEGYLFLFVSDEDVSTIDYFLSERKFPGNFIKLNGYFANFGISAVPSSWLLDENGDVVQTWAGAYEWDSEEMLAQIRNPEPE